MVKNGSNDNGSQDKRTSAFVSRRAILDAALDIQLPALPRNVRTVLALTSEHSVDARRIADAILRDMGLTLRFFRLMNSAFFSPYRQDIVSIRFMVVLLGFDNTSNIVSSVPLMTVAEQQLEARLMGMSLLCSEFARALSEVSILETETAVPCAMFVSLGHVALAAVVPDAYGSIWTAESFPWSRGTFKKSVGWLPKDLALRLCHAWNMPMLVRECIQPPEDMRRLKEDKVALIQTLSALEQLIFCAALMRNSEETQGRLRERIKKVLKLSNKRFGAAMKKGLLKFEENNPVFYEVLRRDGIVQQLVV